MRAVVQRVSQGQVEVDGQKINHIGKGLLVYLSIGKGDTIKDTEFIAEKLVNLRIFSDANGKMNRSVLDEKGAILLISNFTLHGDCRKGRRPSFDAAAEPELAQQLYEQVADLITQQEVEVRKGVFGGHMHISSTNDGPVTFLLDSTKQF
jgi:D-tyrosyl-tRNA(Tyr) deacylase